MFPRCIERRASKYCIFRTHRHPHPRPANGRTRRRVTKHGGQPQTSSAGHGLQCRERRLSPTQPSCCHWHGFQHTQPQNDCKENTRYSQRYEPENRAITAQLTCAQQTLAEDNCAKLRSHNWRSWGATRVRFNTKLCLPQTKNSFGRFTEIKGFIQTFLEKRKS